MNDFIIVLVTLIFSAFFSGMEIAFVSANKLKIELNKNKSGYSGRVVAWLMHHPSEVLSTLLLGNNIALVIYGIAIAHILEPWLRHITGFQAGGNYLILLLQTVISTLLILVTAEFLPKVLFRLRSNSILSFFALPVRLFYILLFPVVRFFTWVSEGILRLFTKIPEKREFLLTHVDLEHYLQVMSGEENEGEEVIKEVQMLKNAIGFKEIKLRECMVPRTEITAVEENAGLEKLKKLFIESGHSKILVYKDSVDNITGFIHTSDVFNMKPDAAIIKYIHKVPIYPETIPAHKVLSDFIQQHRSIAVVVDEFGGTSGIVTLEDIIEEIFGEIEDEFDDESLTEVVIDDSTWIFSARHEIDYLNEKYHLNLPVSDDYETLGGLIIHIHESIPSPGEVIEMKPFRFTIKSASNNRIESLELKIIPEME
ncbi:MAG: hemolysin family protein [Bacteroidales bacterium]